MTELHRPITRRVPVAVGGRRIIVTLRPDGLSIRLERSRGSKYIGWEALMAQLQGVR